MRMNTNIVLLFCALFFLSACTSKPSSSVTIEDDTLPVEETYMTDFTDKLSRSIKHHDMPLIS